MQVSNDFQADLLCNKRQQCELQRVYSGVTCILDHLKCPFGSKCAQYNTNEITVKRPIFKASFISDMPEFQGFKIHVVCVSYT